MVMMMTSSNEKKVGQVNYSGKLCLVSFYSQFTPLLSNNQYSVRKTAAQAMMDVALMMANISQLRTLLSGGSVHITYFYLLLSLVIFSLFRCVERSRCKDQLHGTVVPEPRDDGAGV